MARGSRSGALPIGQTGLADSAAPKQEPTTPSKARKVVIGTGFNVDDMLALDSDGVDLMFEQTDKFLPLADAVAVRLTSLNKTRYNLAKEFHDAWRGDEHAEFVSKFSVDRQMVGSATDKLHADKVPGMRTRWFRPDRIAEARNRGYKILSADEANTYLGPTGGHHEVGRIGQTELVLMGIPEEIAKRRDADKVRKNNEMAGAYEASALAEMRQAGGSPFKAVDETKDRSHAWTDLPTEG